MTANFVNHAREMVERPARALDEILGDKDAREESGQASQLLEQIRDGLVRAKAVTGVQFPVIHQENAQTRLTEAEMWIEQRAWSRARTRLAEAVLWARRGITATKQRGRG